MHAYLATLFCLLIPKDPSPFLSIPTIHAQAHLRHTVLLGNTLPEKVHVTLKYLGRYGFENGI